jgi:hypothetical protein
MAVRPEVSSPKTSWSASIDIATALIASLLVGGSKTMPMKATGWRAARRIRVCFEPFAASAVKYSPRRQQMLFLAKTSHS